MTQVTRFNDALFSELQLSSPEEIWYTSFDGKKIHGWIQKPPDFNPAKKYPMILEIHGGPHAAYSHTFTHEFHWMAAKGICRALHQPARQFVVRARFWKHHPISLSGQ